MDRVKELFEARMRLEAALQGVEDVLVRVPEDRQLRDVREDLEGQVARAEAAYLSALVQQAEADAQLH
jgi:hypothetical protein